MDASLGGSVKFSSGSTMASSERLLMGDSNPIKDGDEGDDQFLTSFEVDPSSASQNIYTALILLFQALKTVPLFTFVSFALSFLFLVMHLICTKPQVVNAPAKAVVRSSKATGGSGGSRKRSSKPGKRRHK